MEENINYKKVFIKTAQDLPKEEGMYFVAEKDYKYLYLLKFERTKNYGVVWLRDIDWYLQPVEPQEPVITDELHLITSGLKALKVLRTVLSKANLLIGVQTADIMIAEFEDYLDNKKIEPQEPKQHETCDGCQMFGDNGCNLDVSICPDCFEHDQWTPKVQPKQTAEVKYLVSYIPTDINFLTGEIIRICDEFVSFDNKCIAVKQKIEEYTQNQQTEVSDEDYRKNGRAT